jgi:hypothetical protein
MVIEGALTFRQWYRKKGFSKSIAYKIRNGGYGPDLIELPGVRGVYVTSAADAAFDQRIAEYSASRAAELERARRREIGRHAVKARRQVG